MAIEYINRKVPLDYVLLLQMLIMSSFIKPCQCRANLTQFSIKTEESYNLLPTIPFSNTMQQLSF